MSGRWRRRVAGSLTPRIRLVALGCLALLAPAIAAAQAVDDRPVLRIPRVFEAPTLADFREMGPSVAWEGRLARVGDFLQTQPSDGTPSTERTDVYVGYDAERLYAIFVAFDSRPGNVRARKTRREDLSNDDDWVELAIDTFNDQRRAYLFDSNPLGVQWDALWTEGQGEDASFDTVYHTDGLVTDRGYVVWMAIPFKSLRFSPDAEQAWGIQFQRFMPRVPEQVAWPHISSRVQGRLNQAARLEGLRDVSPGRNVQLIPYGASRAFRALDARAAGGPRFASDALDAAAGLDAKMVVRDSFVLDATVNPDFSQVESDNPQVTANQRFEVFFPEKRPFFIENANYFRTPIRLVFTRRVADPRLGVRLTGKQGPWAIGALAIDDEAPGLVARTGDPVAGRRAGVGIVRVSRDLGRQSSVGLLYTDRELADGFNRVGGVDGLLRLGRNWTGSLQAVTSATRLPDGRSQAGPAYLATVRRDGRTLDLDATYRDIGEGFRTELGFVNRTGFRSLDHGLSFRVRPEGRWLIAWGPDLDASTLWARDGRRLDWSTVAAMAAELTGQTRVRAFRVLARERIRPADSPGLDADRDFASQAWGVSASSSALSWAPLRVNLRMGQRVNFVPPRETVPFLADETGASVRVTLRPSTTLRVQNDYILSRLNARAGGARVFANHIVRSNWNWQLTRPLSLRLIAQYETLLANPALTRLETTKRVNADVLVTYRVNPWTALFVGYNTNFQNLALCGGPETSRRECEAVGIGERALSRTSRNLLNDGRQLFVKLSYLIRF